jgi:undecaprenyl-diphosphatase
LQPHGKNDNQKHDHRVGIAMSERGDPHRPLLKFLVVGLVAALLTLAFVLIGGEVSDGDTRRLDMQMLRWAQTLRLAHPDVTVAMRDLSALGSTTVLTLVTLFAFAYLVMDAQRKTALLMACSVISGTVLVGVFKTLYGRVRPDAAYADIVVPGLSFPSGHASMSAVVYVTLGALLATTRATTHTTTRATAAQRIVILTLATAVALLVGVSRIVLGVHWTTDVVGGWALGASWALLWLMLARYLVRPQPDANRHRAHVNTRKAT